MLDLAFTVVNVPYTALTPELTRDYDERTSLNSYRFAFSIGSGLLAAVLHPIIVNALKPARRRATRLRRVGGAVGHGLGGCVFLCLLGHLRASHARRGRGDSVLGRLEDHIRQPRLPLRDRHLLALVAGGADRLDHRDLLHDLLAAQAGYDFIRHPGRARQRAHLAVHLDPRSAKRWARRAYTIAA